MNVTQLSTPDLDQLIREAIEERAKRPEGYAEQPPQTLACAPNPPWRGSALADGVTLLSFCLPGHGWVGAALPANERSNLATWPLRMALDHPAVPADPDRPAGAVPAPTASGGQTVH
jgi:hypothetical protein